MPSTDRRLDRVRILEPRLLNVSGPLKEDRHSVLTSSSSLSFPFRSSPSPSLPTLSLLIKADSVLGSRRSRVRIGVRRGDETGLLEPCSTATESALSAARLSSLDWLGLDGRLGGRGRWAGPFRGVEGGGGAVVVGGVTADGEKKGEESGPPELGGNDEKDEYPEERGAVCATARRGVVESLLARGEEGKEDAVGKVPKGTRGGDETDEEEGVCWRQRGSRPVKVLKTPSELTVFFEGGRVASEACGGESDPRGRARLPRSSWSSSDSE